MKKNVGGKKGGGQRKGEGEEKGKSEVKNSVFPPFPFFLFYLLPLQLYSLLPDLDKYIFFLLLITETWASQVHGRKQKVNATMIDPRCLKYYKCRDKRQCDKCKKTGHHTSICRGETTPNLHVATKGAIAYQTVQAKINIPGYDSVPCRMLLDTGSDKTYLVQKIADRLKGKPIRHETKVLDTIHGSRSHRCAVYNLEIRNMEGEVQLITEAATLSKLTTVRNARPEIVQQRFKHLKDIKFSDVSEHDELEIHVIIGLEDLGRVKTGRYIRGEEDQPIAEETKLGWTLLGPTYQGTKTDDQESKLLFCMENRPEIATEVDRLWDLETVGFREGDPVHVEFKDTVKFNARRYVVNLPWKSATAKATLTDNKKLCEKRLRSQLKRLSRVPEQLEAYDGIIQEQIKAGIVEKVPKKEVDSIEFSIYVLTF